jgi:hypothetical protein
MFGTDGIAIMCGNKWQPSPINVGFHSNRALFFWGAGSTSNGCTATMQGEGISIIVGEDCMFAERITLRNSDMHPIVDIRTGEWLNPPKNVLIEPHVWAAQEAIFQKGITVGFGSIIAARSVVTKDVPRFSIAAGAPAVVRRENVSWDRPAIPCSGVHSLLERYATQLG